MQPLDLCTNCLGQLTTAFSGAAGCRQCGRYALRTSCALYSTLYDECHDSLIKVDLHTCQLVAASYLHDVESDCKSLDSRSCAMSGLGSHSGGLFCCPHNSLHAHLLARTGAQTLDLECTRNWGKRFVL